MITATSPKTADGILRTDLNDGLTPLDLAYLVYDLTNLYNIRLFSHSLIERFANNTIAENEAFVGDVSHELIVNPKFTGIPNGIVDELNSYLNNNKNMLGEQDVHWTIDEFHEFFKLRLKRINYNSPGSLDLMGIGKITEQVKDFILKKKDLEFEKKKYSDLIKKNELEMIRVERELELEFELKEEQLTEIKKENEHKARMRELEYREKLADIQLKEIDVTLKYLTFDNDFIANNEKLQESVNGSAKRLVNLLKAHKIDDLKLLNEDEEELSD